MLVLLTLIGKSCKTHPDFFVKFSFSRSPHSLCDIERFTGKLDVSGLIHIKDNIYN